MALQMAESTTSSEVAAPAISGSKRSRRHLRTEDSVFSSARPRPPLFPADSHWLYLCGLPMFLEHMYVDDIQAIWREREYKPSVNVYYNHYDRSPQDGYQFCNWVPKRDLLDRKDKFAALMGGSPHHPRTVALSSTNIASLESDFWPAIAKPATGDSGTGIHIIPNASVATAFAASTGTKYVLQQYMKKPALMGGHKADFRCFILLLPRRKTAFLHEIGVGRVSSQKYALPDTSESFALAKDAILAHLTNMCLHEGRHTEEVLKLKVSLQEFISVQPTIVQKRIRTGLKQAVSDMATSFCAAVAADLVAPIAFEPYILLGVDVLIEESGHVMLIECNSKFTTYYERDGSVNARKAEVLADVFAFLGGADVCTLPLIECPALAKPSEVPERSSGGKKSTKASKR
jgi:hypothetical protein